MDLVHPPLCLPFLPPRLRDEVSLIKGLKYWNLEQYQLLLVRMTLIPNVRLRHLPRVHLSFYLIFLELLLLQEVLKFFGKEQMKQVMFGIRLHEF